MRYNYRMSKVRPNSRNVRNPVTRNTRQWLLVFAVAFAILPLLRQVDFFKESNQPQKERHLISGQSLSHLLHLRKKEEEPEDERGNARFLTGGPTWPKGVWWQHPKLKNWKGCVSKPGTGADKQKRFREPRGYLRVTCSGGINQQRKQICEAVAMAAHLQTSLVLPVLKKSQVWKDESAFDKIFDLKHFVSQMKKEVPIITEEEIPFTVRHRSLFEVEPPLYASLEWWDENVYPKLNANQMVRVSSIHERAPVDDVPHYFQALRCRACFHALRWAPKVRVAGDLLTGRLQAEARRLNSTKGFLALHLRLEKDSLSHAGCLLQTNNSKAEAQLEDMRDKLWKGQKLREDSFAARKAAGHCPLTALEAARFLEGLGYPYHTPIYIAGGKPEKGSGLGMLRHKFPNLYSKDTLLTGGEIRQFGGSPSQLAALDGLACLNATVFVSTHGGNMADFLIGERIYAGRGLSLTPHKAFLVDLFSKFEDNAENLPEVISRVRQKHADLLELPFHTPFMNDVTNETKSISVYRLPIPECVCAKGKPLFKGLPKFNGTSADRVDASIWTKKATVVKAESNISTT